MVSIYLIIVIRLFNIYGKLKSIYIFGIGPKTKKKKKPKVSVNKSILKKEIPRMSKAVTSQVCISLLL